MKSLFTHLFILGIFPLIVLSCSDDPSSIGLDLLPGGNLYINTFNTQNDSTVQYSSYYKDVVPLGLSIRIFIGIKGDLEASTLMKFDFLLDDSLKNSFLNDSISVTEALIKLYPNYTYNNAQQSMDFTIHKINNYWTSSTFTIDSLPLLMYDNQDMSSNKNFSDSLYTLDIDNNLVLSWIKTSFDTTLEKNYGIYFKPSSGSGKIVGFPAYSLSDTNFASLTVVVNKLGSYVDTITGYLTSDVSVISGNLPVLPEGEISVQGGLAVKSKLFFDITNIPENVIINNAQLILTQDTLNSVLSKSGAGSIAVYSIADSTTDSIDVYSSVLMTRQDNIFTGTITSIVDKWINRKDNQGLIITTGTLTDNLELLAIKGSDYSNFPERPVIKITYTSRK